ncbi:MAG: TonB-dependent receptor [Candidatus Eiseniibacteriota bacterium]
MSVRMVFIALSLSLGLGTGAASAAEPPASALVPADSTVSAQAAQAAQADTVVELPAIEVSEARSTDAPLLRLTPGFARSYDLTYAHGRFRTASDVLAGNVGVHVRQFGGLGAFSAVSIRGSSASQVAVYLDGVPLNQAQYGVVNASDLPIEALGSIEVYRGTAPLAFDSPGGGVVQLVTRRQPGVWGRVSAGAGAFGTRRSDASGGVTRGRTSVLAVAQWLESEGDFAYYDDNGTSANSNDDEWAVRVNNAFRSLALTGRITQGVGPAELALTHDHLDKDQGSPGTGANTALDASFATDRSVTSLSARSLTTRFAPGALLYAVRHRDRFADPARELTGMRVATDDHTSKDGLRLDASHALPLGHALFAAAEGRLERYEPALTLPEPRDLAGSDREWLMLGLEDRWSLAGGRVGVTGQIRRESTFDDFPAGPAYPGALPSPAVSRTTRFTRWSLGARGDVVRGAVAGGAEASLALRASVSRLGRVPSLEELFGNRGGVHGNPAARPEEIETRDVGLVGSWERRVSAPGSAARWAPRWIEGQAAIYRSDANDLLVYMQNTNSYSVAMNISAARLEGFELGLRAAWEFGLSADLEYTRQWTRDEGDVAYWYGRELPGRPAHEVAARTLYASPETPFRPFAELHHIGAHFMDRANLQRIPARTLIDLGITGAFARYGLEATIECRNLTDSHVQDFGGYPLPGRAFYASIRFLLDRKDGKS